MSIVLLILKIIGWVLLGILALVIILLLFDAVVKVHIGEDGFRFEVRYLFLKLYPRGKKSAESGGDEKESKTPEDSFDEPDYDEFDDTDLDDEIDDYELMHGLDEAKEKQLAELADEQQTEEEQPDAETKTEVKAEPKKKEKSEKKMNKKESPESVEEEDKPKGLKAKIDDLKAKYNTIKPYIPVTWKYFRKLLKAVRIYIDDVGLLIGREDAHEAAIYYGSLQWILATVLDMLKGMFTVKIKKCKTDCKFTENTFSANADLTVRARLITIVGIVLCVGVKFLIIFLRQRRQNKKAKKAKNVNNDSEVQQKAA